jgi:F-type H+-transporting ATPase subunit gamma
MKSLQELKQKKTVTEDLQSVVKTMKSLAAVNIRQYQRASESLEIYDNTIEMGFHILMKAQPWRSTGRQRRDKNVLGAIVFGSERGMCGQFNDLIVDFADDQMAQLSRSSEKTQILVIGERAKSSFDAQSDNVEYISLPASLSEFVPVIHRILLQIERWQARDNADQIVLFHNKPTSAASFSQNRVFLLPLDLDWLESLKTKQWPSNTLPDFTMDWDRLFSSLVRQYFFVSLYRAMAESLAGENASRLTAMQAAEKNIEERLDEITTKYNHQRQESITAELLDVVSGFEALTSS